MKVLTYRDLESKDDLLPLMDHAFRWPFNPRTFEQYIKIDPRMKHSPVGFCALEGGKVIGFVGVMDLATRTLDGSVEYVGGVYGVATLPSHVRKGVSRTLMNRAHEHFKDKGYRFSFLTTAHTLVAYLMYEKLGYTDLFEIPSVYKVLKTKKSKPAVKEKPAKLDLDKILKIHAVYVEGKAGFVLRDMAYMKMLKKSERLNARESIIDDNGYVFFRRERNGILIRELVALNNGEMGRLISLVEGKAKDLVCERTVLDDALLHAYKSRGYMVQKRSHSVVMVKPLTAKASCKQEYGDKLFLTGLDYF